VKKTKNAPLQSEAARTPQPEPTLPTTIIRLPIADLKLDAKNPRVHSKRQIEQLSKSIKSFGFLWPVMIDGTRRVLAGHGRIAAAKRLGLQELPTISIDHLSESQRRAFIIADNRLAEQASWDEKLLGEQLKELLEVELDFDLEATGFEVGEIDVLVEGVSPEVKGNSDPADDLPQIKPVEVTRAGDLWLAGPHRICCGSSLNPDSYSVLMKTGRAAVVFMDPPFNVEIDGHAARPGTIPPRNAQRAFGEMTEAEFTDFLTQVMQRCVFCSVDGSLHYAFMDWRHMPELLAAGKQVYSELMSVCVWVKDHSGGGSPYRSQHELILVFKKGKQSHRNNVQLRHQERCRTNVWHYRGVKPFCHSSDAGNLPELHPTVKPVALVAEAIMDCTSRGDIVLDPFLGSGTTLIAAERTSRVCYGIELDPQYVDTIVRRWQAITGQSARLESSGRTFAELEQEVGNAVKG
jgi:DNA modification methylase